MTPTPSLLLSPVSDHTYTVTDSPRTLKRRFDVTDDKLQRAKRALYNAERREGRAKATLESVLSKLEKQNLIAADLRQQLEVYDSLPAELFNKESHVYTPEQRKFATTLHFYSPKAYEFARKSLQLPAASTLRRWVSSIDYRPGFSEQVFTSLSKRLSGENGWQYKTCSVMIDGMSIRKHVDWDAKDEKMVGFSDLGAGALDSDSQQEATEALVIMAVGLTGHWKVPLGYFLISGISATLQSELIKTAFIKLHDIGICGMALVMDGHATNQAMVTQLGGSLIPKKIKSTFPHPSVPEQPVCIFFDACHMLKLLRNALEAMKQIVLPNGRSARWSDVSNLHELQQAEGLRAGNRLTTSHVQFQKQKMKVSLAAQTLSASVAKALEFLQTNDIAKFEDTAGTQEFIAIVDRLFDVFNSRTTKATGYKRPLTQLLFPSVKPFLMKSRDMLLNMTDSTGRKISESRRHMAALGFVINIDSLEILGEELLIRTSQYHQKYLLTYKLSQDHLELFFGCIRRMGGWNNNPSAKQFGYAYRTLLSRAAVTGSLVANVTQQDNTDLLHLDGERNAENNTFVPVSPAFDNDHDYATIRNLSHFTINVLEYIAGWVVRKLCSKLACADCMAALVMPASAALETHSLLQIKNNGGLVQPSAGVVKVIQHAEKILRETVNVKRILKTDQWGQMLEGKVLETLPTVFEDFAEHFRNSLHGIDSHYTELIRNLCRIFLKLRRFHTINLFKL